jgi:hypothetical protein
MMRRLILAALLLLGGFSDAIAVTDGYGFSPREGGQQVPFYRWSGGMKLSAGTTVSFVNIPVDKSGRYFIKAQAICTTSGAGDAATLTIRIDSTDTSSIIKANTGVSTTFGGHATTTLEVPDRDATTFAGATRPGMFTTGMSTVDGVTAAATGVDIPLSAGQIQSTVNLVFVSISASTCTIRSFQVDQYLDKRQ